MLSGGTPAPPASVDRALADLAVGESGRITEVGGERGFRRRLMELGLVPGTSISLHKIAPLGDPLELRVRGCRLSIRAAEARLVRVGADSASEHGEH